MYCKFCGNKIDDDSLFCKHCGKQLEKNESYVGLLNNGTAIKICLALLWIAYSIIVPKGIYYYVEHNTISILYMLITPIVYYILYYLNLHYSKNPISLNIKVDSVKTKILKSAYVIYSVIIPSFCCEHGNADEFFGLMAMLWLIPTVLIYLVYFFQNIKDQESK